MSKQPFPGLNSAIADKAGLVTPVWRAFLQALWQRGGGSIADSFAMINGSADERFSAAPPVALTDVVTLGQGNARYQPKGSYAALAGSSGQTFEVADAVDATGAVSLYQLTAAAALLVARTGGVFTTPPQLPVYTVAGLPVAAAGCEAWVIDATVRTFGVAPTGGGALGVGVKSIGASWIMG